MAYGKTFSHTAHKKAAVWACQWSVCLHVCLSIYAHNPFLPPPNKSPPWDWVLGQFLQLSASAVPIFGPFLLHLTPGHNTRCSSVILFTSTPQASILGPVLLSYGVGWGGGWKTFWKNNLVLLLVEEIIWTSLYVEQIFLLWYVAKK